MHAIVLRIKITGNQDTTWIAEALGECARNLEAHEASGETPLLGLVHDEDDPGRYAWEIVTESYTF